MQRGKSKRRTCHGVGCGIPPPYSSPPIIPPPPQPRVDGTIRWAPPLRRLFSITSPTTMPMVTEGRGDRGREGRSSPRPPLERERAGRHASSHSCDGGGRRRGRGREEETGEEVRVCVCEREIERGQKSYWKNVRGNEFTRTPLFRMAFTLLFQT